MEIKLFEIRDRATFIPAMAIKPVSDHPLEYWLLRRSGFGPDTHCIYLVKLEGQDAKYDPYNWGDSRTMHTAHLYIEKNWETLKTGDVIDVEFILEESAAPKQSERLTSFYSE